MNNRNAVVAVVLLFVLFGAALPQVSRLSYPNIDEIITKTQGQDKGPDDVYRLLTEGLTASNEPVNGDLDGLWRARMVTARGTREDNQGNLPNSGSAAASSPVSPPTPTQTQAPPMLTRKPVPPSPANPAPKHIGLQAGHWKYKEAPAPLNAMTGTSGGGKTEPEITLAIADEVARILRSWGHRVDILPTVIPPGYKSDLFVSIHADGSTNSGPRGFFTDRPVGSPVAAAEARLSSAIDAEYAATTGIPYTNRSTPGSRYYYGYRDVAAEVPMILIETGFLTNALDREILVKQPQKAAEGIANGIKRYLGQ